MSDEYCVTIEKNYEEAWNGQKNFILFCIKNLDEKQKEKKHILEVLLSRMEFTENFIDE